MKRKMIWVTLLICCKLWMHQSYAQYASSTGSSEIMLSLQKLKVLGSVLYIAAHPDDENTRLLTWLSKDRLYRTGYLSLTRGDGGQNLIGEEQGIALGLIRTQELLAARRVDGAEQFFTRAYDFGFSKKTEEALSIWDREKVLSDVVWVIRNFKPDVIITRFPEDSRAGHGHHSGSAVLAHEAFDAAGDPKRFPEQFAYGVQPWKPKRILWNTFSFGSMNTTAPDQYKVDVGGFNAFIGKSYGELAAESRSQHKSQGFGVPSSRGTALEYFLPVSGDPLQKDLMDGVDISWSRVPNSAMLLRKIDEVISAFNFVKPEASVKSLVELYDEMSKLEDGYWKKRKMMELQQIISHCAGLFMEAVTIQPYAVQGDSLKCTVNLINRSSTLMKLKKIQLEVADSSVQTSMTFNKNFSFPFSIKISADRELSQPYWLKEKMNKGFFNINEQQLIGKPENDPSFRVLIELEIEGRSFVFERPVMYKFTDPVKGELIQPFAVVPAMSVNTSPGILVFKKNQNAVMQGSMDLTAFTDVSVTNSVMHVRHNNTQQDRILGPLKIKRASKYSVDIPLARKNNSTDKELILTTGDTSGKDVISTGIEFGNAATEHANYLAMATINYDHIPTIRYFYQDPLTVLHLDVKTYGKKAGYIKGAGDKVPEAMEQLGYEVTFLNENDIEAKNLKQFDVIVTGIRAYNMYEWLPAKYDALMEYVRDGGNFVVQYNTNSFVGPMKTAKIGPYDMTILNSRITDEDAPMNVVDPSHPLLNEPNKISAKDFEGWIQERGIYFADKFAPEYKPVFALRDPGETEDRMGSLLMANYGKGRFIYTGLVFFRELPAGVPGAYRLFANLLSNPNSK